MATKRRATLGNKRGMFADKYVEVLKAFDGGLNNKFAATLIADNELSEIQNFNFDEKGTLTKREGYRKHYASPFDPNPVRGLYNYRKEDGTSRLIAAASDKLYYDTPHFQTIYDTNVQWNTGTHDGTVASAGDLTLADEAGELGLIEVGNRSAILGGGPGTRSGNWVSPAIDISAVSSPTSGVITETSNVPAGASRTIYTRTAATSNMAGASAYQALGAGNSIQSPGNNYLQVKVELSATLTGSPTVSIMTITYDQSPTMSVLASGLDTVARYRFETQNDTLWIVNGVNVNKKWTGSGAIADQGGTPPVAKLVIVHKNRMFMAGTAANRSRVYFCDLGSPEVWPALNFIDVGKGDGDSVTGFAILFDSLVIAKDNSIWMLAGDSPSNFALRKASGEGGYVWQSSLQLIKNTLVGLGRLGVTFFDGVKVALASEKIEGSIEDINQSQFQLGAGISWKNKYWLSVPEGSAIRNNWVLVFDTLRTAWTIYRGMAFSEFVVWRRYNADTLMAGSANEGQIYELEAGIYNDAGSAIDAFAVTKQLFGSEQSLAKLLRQTMISAKEILDGSAILEVRFRADNGSDSTPQNLSISGKMNVKRAIPSISGISIVRTVAVKVRNNELDKGVNVSQIEVEYVPKGVREK